MSVTLVTYASISNPGYDENMHRYATTKELKKKALRINNQNSKWAIDIQVTFISEIKLQIELFLAKSDCFFFKTYTSILNPC